MPSQFPMDKQDDSEKIAELQRAAKAVIETKTAQDNEQLRRAAMAACKHASAAGVMIGGQ